jgi:hypothetical protein
MPNLPISQLTAAGSALGTDVIPIARLVTGVEENFSVTAAEIAALSSGGVNFGAGSGICFSSSGQLGVGSDLLEGIGGTELLGLSANQVGVFKIVIPFTITVSTITIYGFGNNSSFTNYGGFGLYSIAGAKIIDGGGLVSIAANTNVDAVFSASFSPVTLTPGAYWFAEVATGPSSMQVSGIQALQIGSLTPQWLLGNHVSTKIGTAANASSGLGVLPATLGTITPITAVNTVYSMALVLFE